jgi:hypothetical protein
VERFARSCAEMAPCVARDCCAFALGTTAEKRIRSREEMRRLDLGETFLAAFITLASKKSASFVLWLGAGSHSPS